MRIDRKLNIVFEVERDEGNVWVHSAPITQETFEQFVLPIAKTFTQIYAEQLNIVAGPRVAAMLLKRNAQSLGMWEGPMGVQNGLFNEIRRLTNVIVPVDRGWSTMPLHDAMQKDLFTEKEASEVEGEICFFIVLSAMHKKTILPTILEGMTGLWDVRIELSNCTEFANSLPTLTETESSGAMVAGLSVPS